MSFSPGPDTEAGKNLSWLNETMSFRPESWERPVVADPGDYAKAPDQIILTPVAQQTNQPVNQPTSQPTQAGILGKITLPVLLGGGLILWLLVRK